MNYIFSVTFVGQWYTLQWNANFNQDTHLKGLNFVLKSIVFLFYSSFNVHSVVFFFFPFKCFRVYIFKVSHFPLKTVHIKWISRKLLWVSLFPLWWKREKFEIKYDVSGIFILFTILSRFDLLFMNPSWTSPTPDAITYYI